MDQKVENQVADFRTRDRETDSNGQSQKDKFNDTQERIKAHHLMFEKRKEVQRIQGRNQEQ